jgi:hypothetical protein
MADERKIYGCANQTASVFLTQIIGRFGKSTVVTNLMTVGPYGAATIVLCELCAPLVSPPLSQANLGRDRDHLV